MPTEYTADLPKTFPEFAMRCARNFGALIEMRDLSLDAPIPKEFKADDYRTKELKKTQADLSDTLSWTDDDAEQEAKRAYEKALKGWESNERRVGALLYSYTDMLRQVESWKPPTTNHAGLKRFMIQQLEDAIKFDCVGYDKPKPMTGRAYKLQEVRRLTRDVAYHIEHQDRERELAEERTKWVRDLRESLAKWTT